MKKFLCLFLALLMIASVALVACKTDDDYVEPNDDDDDDIVVNTTTAPSGATTTTDAPQVFTPCDEQVYVVNCTQLNLREEPNENSYSLGTISFGDEKSYKCVEKSSKWCKLQLDDGSFAYANAKFLTTSTDYVKFEPVTKTIYVIAENTFNLRTYTDQNDENVYTAVKFGAELKVTGQCKYYYRISYTDPTNGKTLTLYCASNAKYVSDTAPQTTAGTGNAAA